MAEVAMRATQCMPPAALGNEGPDACSRVRRALENRSPQYSASSFNLLFTDFLSG